VTVCCKPDFTSSLQRNVSKPTVVVREPAHCTFNAALNRFVCDNWLPTLDELLARMQGVDDAGRATRENRVFFFTKLVDASVPRADPQYTVEVEKVFSNFETWARIPAYGENWYSAFNRPLNSQWQKAQYDHIEQNYDNFAAKYKVQSLINLMNLCYSQAFGFCGQGGNFSKPMLDHLYTSQHKIAIFFMTVSDSESLVEDSVCWKAKAPALFLHYRCKLANNPSTGR
jgi:hypothetical protein